MSLQVTSSVPLAVQPFRFQATNGDVKQMDILTSIYQKTLEPLYGSQAEALEKIRQGKDRKAFLAYEGETPVGVLVYKTVPTDEYEKFGVKKSLEVKSLFVVDADKNSGRGVGGRLVEQAEKVARAAGAVSMHLTVSAEKPEPLEFFKKKNFTVQTQFEGKYKAGVSEYLLQKVLPALSREEPQRHDFEFHRILGNERHHRMEIVQDFVRRQFSAVHGSKNSDKTKIEQAKDIDGRLLEDNGHAVGVLLYNPKLTDEFAKFGPKNSFKLTAFLGEEQEARSELLEKALEKAHALHAQSCTVFMSTRQTPSAAFLRAHNFKTIATVSAEGPELLALNLGRAESKPTPAPSAQPIRKTYSGPGSEQNPWQATLKKQYIHFIQQGKKTVEGRIRSGMFARYRKGDYVRFFYQQNPQDDVVCRIADIRTYNDFASMVSKEDFRRAIPDVKSVEDAIAIYDTIPGYRERARQSGVLAIHIQPVKKQ